NIIACRAASSDTDGVSVSDRARMSRRVPSAKARKSWLSDSSLSFSYTTIWLYISPARSICQPVCDWSLLCPTKNDTLTLVDQVGATGMKYPARIRHKPSGIAPLSLGALAGCDQPPTNPVASEALSRPSRLWRSCHGRDGLDEER